MKSFYKITLISLLSLSCAKTPPIKKEVPEFDNGSRADDLNKTEQETPKQKDPISVLDLDKPDLKVTGVTAGLVSFMNSQAPVVSYFLPKKADYIELIRCDCNTKLLGTTTDLENLDLGDPKVGADEILINDYWAATCCFLQKRVVKTCMLNTIFYKFHITSF